MRTVIERYYDQYFSIDNQGKENEDQYINQHSNGVFVVGLAPTHPIISEQKSILKIEYSQAALNNVFSGSGKKGAVKMNKETAMCTIHCVDGTSYSIYPCVKGKLLEINKILIDNPSMLLSKHATSAYICMIDPYDRETYMDKYQSKFLTFEQYHLKRNIPIQRGPTFKKDSDFGSADDGGGGNQQNQ
ncbi:hypothetical protein DFA_06736 [Cavenderia fasciculata]|uniref:Protein Abitram n=1 Tax=Cavenderia fasciculata TaxID=261658 RepID=F4Q249_CACFS|nr:uncharacterized protein DFA_06736 [Cavenderia fasciculata]EGG18069.1 hypothetical protein DFA_06736 [Cavenderia fasciculata]|eukprot:XP_004356962.1 hypothetical protein DFA_06736 [Cavenderia fasciculata]